MFNLILFLSPLFAVQWAFKSFVYYVSLWIYLPAQHRQYSSTPLYSLCPRIGQRGGASRLMFIGCCWKTGRELEQSCAPGSVHALFHLLSTHRIPKKEYICVSLIKLVGIKYNIMNVNQSLLQLRTVKRSDLAMFQTRFPFPHLLPGACLWLTGTSLPLDHSNRTSSSRQWAVYDEKIKVSLFRHFVGKVIFNVIHVYFNKTEQHWHSLLPANY